MSMSQPLLATEGVSKSFNGLSAVNTISYQLEEKEAAGIIGPNGAGKSTFFNLLTGLYLPDKGRVLYQGEDITRMPAYDRVTRGIARTFQLVSVFDSLLVLENMMLARIRMGRDYASKGRFFFKECAPSRLGGRLPAGLENPGHRSQGRNQNRRSVLR